MRRKVSKLCAFALSLTLAVSTLTVPMAEAKGKSQMPKLSVKKVSVTVGQTKKLKVAKGTVLSTKWSIKNKKLAALSAKKKKSVTIKGKKAGKTTVTAKVKTKKGTKKLTCKVTVKKKTQPVKESVASAVPSMSPTTAPTTAPTMIPTAVPTTASSAAPTTVPTASAKPTEPAGDTVPEGYEKLDLSTYTTADETKDAYDEASKTLHIVDKENFQFPLTQELGRGESVNVILRGTYNGTEGFRSWLIDGSQSTNSNLVSTNNEADFTGGDFELKYTLTATTACQYLFYKGPKYGVNIDDLIIKNIYVSYEASEGGDTVNDPYAPSEEQAYDTVDLKLTTSFSEQKGTIGNNPLMTQSFMADPTAIEYDGRLYLFGTADKIEFDTKGNVIDNSYNTCEIQCISSADLVNWTDHGTIDVKAAASWAGHSWAPTIASKEIDGKSKFFLYFANGGDGIGVLTADSPLGPWSDPVGGRLISRDTPNCDATAVPWLFDPSVLVDDDGTGYLYFGGGTSGLDSANPKSSRVVKLGNDMASLAGDPVELAPNYLFEDNEINKIKGKYVYSYCTNWSVPSTDETTGSCCIAFMTSDNPMTGFEYQGQLFANPGSVFGNYYNNHHRMLQFKGEWYIAYHTTLLEETAFGTKKGYRTLHMDKLDVGTHSNGKLTIKAQASYEGLSAVDTLNPYQENDAVTMAWSAGLKTKKSDTLKTMVLDSIHTGDWCGVSDVNFGDVGSNQLTMKLASETTEGKVEVYMDAPATAQGGEKIGEIALKNTGSSDTYEDLSATLTKQITGKHKIYFIFRGSGYHVAKWQFAAETE